MKYIVFDIETNDLYFDTTECHCIAIKVEDKDTQVFTSKPIVGSAGTLEQGLQLLEKYEDSHTLVGHNICNFDLPTLDKLLNFKWKGKILDTLIATKLKYTNILVLDSNNSKLPPKYKGSYSLKAWGYRLGNYKEVHEDWSQLSKEMVEYCRQDVEVNYSLLNRLLLRGLPPQQALDLEHKFATIISRQEKYGWLFDVDKAQKLHIELVNEKDIALTKLLEVFKPLQTWTPQNYPKNAYKKDGNKSVVLLNHEAKGCHYNEDLEWGYYKEVEFNPSSPQARVRFIEHYIGKQKWEVNDKGSPKTGREDLLKLLKDNPIAEPLVHYLTVTKLLGQLAEGDNAWLKSLRNGRIHGSVDTLGAVSRRCTHSKPNVAQVPSNSAYKGHECRELFKVGEGKKLIGCDADALELRTLSHYMARYDNGKYAEAVDKGVKEEGTDIHTLNQKAANLPTRDNAKTFIYGFLYGAGDEKIGEIVKGGIKKGKELRENFLKKIPAIKKLGDGVKEAVAKNGSLKALDGNLYHIRSSHSALNTLLQGAGALVMKYYLVFLDEELQQHYEVGKQYEFVGNIHDEVQIEVDENIAEDVAKICEQTFDKVTKFLNFRIPLRGSADIGDNWSQTH